MTEIFFDSDTQKMFVPQLRMTAVVVETFGKKTFTRLFTSNVLQTYFETDEKIDSIEEIGLRRPICIII